MQFKITHTNERRVSVSMRVLNDKKRPLSYRPLLSRRTINNLLLLALLFMQKSCCLFLSVLLVTGRSVKLMVAPLSIHHFYSLVYRYSSLIDARLKQPSNVGFKICTPSWEERTFLKCHNNYNIYLRAQNLN